MSPLEYLALALEDWPLYLGLLVAFLALHAPLVRWWAVGIYDPLLLLLASNALGWSIVWFMFLRGDIATVYLLSFSAAQIALYLGMGLARMFRGRPAQTLMATRDMALPKLTLAFATGVHVTSSVLIWTVAGIPLLRDSRLGAFQGSGGLGILERLAESSWMIALFSLVFVTLRVRPLRTHPLTLAVWAWLLLAVALSGSKAGLLTLVQCVLSIAFVYGGLRAARNPFWGGRAGGWLILASTVFALAVLTLQHEGDLSLAGVGFLYRVVSYGDIYIFAYPEETLESLAGGNPLVAMFGGFLSTFRLFPQDLLHTNLGIQLVGIVFPNLDVVAGPNPQHPVFGYHYFGPFSVVFSFVLGLLTMTLHTRFYFRRCGTFVAALVAFLLFFALGTVSVDFDYSMSKLANMVIGLVATVVPALGLRPDVAITRLRQGSTRQVPRPA